MNGREAGRSAVESGATQRGSEVLHTASCSGLGQRSSSPPAHSGGPGATRINTQRARPYTPPRMRGRPGPKKGPRPPAGAEDFASLGGGEQPVPSPRP